MKHIKVILYACIERNIGDDLFIQTVCNRYPNVDFFISSEAKYGDLTSVPNLHFRRSLKIWNRISGSRRNGFIARIIKRATASCIRLIFQDVSTSVYIVGNAFKNKNYIGDSQIQWLKERIRITDHFFILSTNFGPYNDRHWEIDCKNIFSLVEDICFRDKYSYSIFKDLPNARYAPDAVLSLGRKKHDSDQYVLLSVIDATMKNRGIKLNEISADYENSIAILIDYFLNTGKKVCLIASNKEQDKPCIDRIISKIETDRRSVEVFCYNGSIRELDYYYRNARLVIGTRLHTIILGWLYGAFVVPIIYDIKVQELLKSYGYKGLSFDISDMKDCTGVNIEQHITSCQLDNLDSLINSSQEQFLRIDRHLGRINEKQL